MKFGQSLIDTAMEALNSVHKFGTLVIKIDAIAPDKPDNGLVKNLRKIGFTHGLPPRQGQPGRPNPVRSLHWV